jgi:hypothetical protein
MAVPGDQPLAIKRVLGHRTFATTEIYIARPTPSGRASAKSSACPPGSPGRPLRDFGQPYASGKSPLANLAENKGF